MILDIRDFHRGGWIHRAAKPALHFALEPVEPLGVEQVLEPRMAPVAAVAVIALHLDHGLRHPDHFRRSGEAERVGEPRIGVLLPMGSPQSPADQYRSEERRVGQEGSARWWPE